jgi:hypothetical protein
MCDHRTIELAPMAEGGGDFVNRLAAVHSLVVYRGSCHSLVVYRGSYHSKAMWAQPLLHTHTRDRTTVIHTDIHLLFAHFGLEIRNNHRNFNFAHTQTNVRDAKGTK